MLSPEMLPNDNGPALRFSVAYNENCDDAPGIAVSVNEWPKESASLTLYDNVYRELKMYTAGIVQYCQYTGYPAEAITGDALKVITKVLLQELPFPLTSAVTQHSAMCVSTQEKKHINRAMKEMFKICAFAYIKIEPMKERQDELLIMLR